MATSDMTIHSLGPRERSSLFAAKQINGETLWKMLKKLQLYY